MLFALFLKGENKMRKKKGISLIVLVITIIVMIILASTVIISLSSSGIINKANAAQEATEIGNEKQLIQVASAEAIGNNIQSQLTVEGLRLAMNKYDTKQSIDVMNNGDTIAVKFNETNRWYEVDTTGNILGTLEVKLDDKGGVLDGNGTATDPFVIMSIDDLIYFTKNSNIYINKYIVLGKTLDFNSDLSYVDKNTTEYDEFLGGDGTIGLKEQLTTGLGYKPIYFWGTFDGKNNVIKNIKIEVDGSAGFFTGMGGTVKNIGVEGRIISRTSYAGGIVSLADATTIENCYVRGTIKSEKLSAGGIVGRIYQDWLTVDRCINYANVSGGSNGSGGIIGATDGGSTTIRNSGNFGIITAMGGGTHDGVGGINGKGGGEIIENCYNAGILKAEYIVDGGYRGAGGIKGNGTVTINNSVHYGTIDAERVNANVGGILGIANKQTTETVKFKQCYFNNEDVTKGIGRSAITEEIAIGKTNTELQSEAFVNELNSNIQNGCPYQVENEDGTTETKTIDTTGWAKWVYNEGAYPTLDLKTKWNGTEWITEKIENLKYK